MKRAMRGKRESNKEEINMAELEEMIRQNPQAILLDVRSPQEYQEGHLNGSILIPSYEVKEKVQMALPDKNRCIIAYCQSGSRSKKTVKILKQLGYKQVYSLKEGLDGK